MGKWTGESPLLLVLLPLPTVNKKESSGVKSSYTCVLGELKSQQLPSGVRQTPSTFVGTVQTGS